jgi:hypothetical protein
MDRKLYQAKKYTQQYSSINPPVWGFDARLTTLFCKKICQEIQKGKPDAIWQNLLRKAMAQKGLSCQQFDLQ